MKILKFNENIEYKEPDYKEYDEYGVFNKTIIDSWEQDIKNVNSYLSDMFHDIHRYNDFITNYVIFYETSYSPNLKMIIADKINFDFYRNKFNIIFYDKITNKSINIEFAKDIKTINDVAEEDPNLFLELYKRYKDHHAQIFNKDEFQHILDADKKYNL